VILRFCGLGDRLAAPAFFGGLGWLRWSLGIQNAEHYMNKAVFAEIWDNTSPATQKAWFFASNTSPFAVYYPIW
jgi:hypothetical protein